MYGIDLSFYNTLFHYHQYPINVWALQGYHECLVQLDRTSETDYIVPQLKVAFSIADVPIKTSATWSKSNIKYFQWLLFYLHDYLWNYF